jgi:hypothetical protein
MKEIESVMAATYMPGCLSKAVIRSFGLRVSKALKLAALHNTKIIRYLT